MKFFKYSVLAVVATTGLAFSACSDDDNYQPGEQSDGVYFTNTNSARVQLPTDATELSVVVARTGSTAEATYPVSVTTDIPDGLFNFPSEVHFAQGETATTYVATCALPEEKEDRNYSLVLSFPENVDVCQYGNSSLSMRVTLLMKTEKFEHYGTAVIVDAWLTAAYTFTGNDGSALTFEDLAWEVNLNASVDSPGVFQLEDAWTCEDSPLTFVGVNQNTTTHENIRIDASDPDFVMIAPQYSGVIWSNNVTGNKIKSCYIGNAGGYLIGDYTKEEIIEKGMATVLQDGYLIEVNPALFGWDDDEEFGYNWNSNPTGIIEFHEGGELGTEALRSIGRRQHAIDSYKVANMKAALGFRKL